MKHTLRFTTSICLMLFAFLGTAQDKSTPTKDSVATKKERYGLRVGLDLSKPIRSLYEKDYRGIEFVADYRLTRRHYLATEFGNEDKTVEEDNLNFTTKGSYAKLGFDYNAYENWGTMENMIYVGMRYGFSNFSQTLNSYSIYNVNHYFNENTYFESGKTEDGLSAHWVEVVAGVKAEIVKNLFAGFSLRLNYLIAQTKPDNFSNLYIPGFNRTYEDGKFGVGFNYTVSYFIPLYKSEVKSKK